MQWWTGDPEVAFARPVVPSPRAPEPEEPGQAELIASAQAGDAQAAHRLGRLYARRGDRSAAREWWERAAAAGSVDSAYNLGVWHEKHGRLDESLRWYELAAEAGDAEAAVNLAVLLLERMGDVAGARRWCEVAATSSSACGGGSRQAARRLAQVCEDAGETTAARDWHRVAALDGDLDSAHDLGFLFYSAGEEEQARHWWELAVRGGHLEAAYHLGLQLHAGGDPESAEALYQLAVTGEHAGAASRLGNLALARGDLRMARAWLERAAHAGRVDDQRMTGFVCVELEDSPGARHWFGLAAAGGDAESAYNFGLLLIAEHNDLHGGCHWLRQAALNGHRQAAVELREVLSLIGSAGEVEETERWPAQPTSWDGVTEPELSARAELAAAAGRRGGISLKAEDLVEILGTWDLITRRLRDPFDAVTRLAERSGLHAGAVEHLHAVRTTLVRPGTAPWPTSAEIEHVLHTARTLRGHLTPSRGQAPRDQAPMS